MAESERTQRIEADEDEQELTRRLSVYEEQDHTQRLRVPPVPPWDSEDVAPEPSWQPKRERRRGRGSVATLVGVLALGIVLGVLATLVVTNGTRSEVQALEAQLADAQDSVADRDTRIGELEQMLEDARSSPIPGIELPPGIDLPNIPLPNEEQRRALAEEVREQIQDRIEDFIGGSG
ncbi:MAG: hypothetical protein ACRDZO_28020 [Egibacteraceae bacterium]